MNQTWTSTMVLRGGLFEQGSVGEKARVRRERSYRGSGGRCPLSDGR